jgi:N-acetylmuramoyl-L-alanine amidase
MSSESKAIKRLINVNSKVGCHYFIKRNGQIILMVPDLYIAWHAGKSNWNKENSLNNNSIGIEVSNKGHQFGYQKFSKTQILSIINLSKYLIKKYNIRNNNILGHSDIAFHRKKDPGERFPWKLLAQKGIGVWHNVNQKKLIKFRKQKINDKDKKKVINFFSKIGYFTNNLSDNNYSKLIKSFQRRFRPELINGNIDKECLIIAEKLSKLYS